MPKRPPSKKKKVEVEAGSTAKTFEEVPVLLIGDSKLRIISSEVTDPKDPTFIEERKRLHLALEQFRTKNGFGRAISAPQIGVNKRLIACNLGKGAFSIINPKITWASDELFTLWDDCMSFPWLMVKVQRMKSISLEYIDEEGNKKEMKNLDMATSELLQHEIDHLDGVLAVDRAMDKTSIIAREVYEKNKSDFDKQVDYFIVPTIQPKAD